MARKLIIASAAIAALLLTPRTIEAQTSFYTDRALQQVNVLTSPTPLTAAIPYGGVRVCSLPLTQAQPCLPLASITDINGNPVSNSIGPLFGQLTTDATGRFTFGCTLGLNYQVQVAASASNTPAVNYPITCPGVGSNPQFVAFTSTGTATLSGGGTALLGTIDGICIIDGISTNRTTLSAAIADTTCKTVDDRGFKSGGTIASTISFSSTVKPMVLLACGQTYTGPASGSTFSWGAGSHGASLIGCSTTSGAFNTGQQTLTKIQGAASNTSDVLSMTGASGNPNGIQGIRVEHIMIDGNSSAVNCLTQDTVQNGYFNDIDAENCTSKGFNLTTTSTIANSGTSFNTYIHLRGAGSPTLFFCSGNIGVADFTANTMMDLQGRFGVGASTAAGIWLNACDGNVFEGVTKPFRISGTGCDMEFDTNAFSNQFYDFYGNTGCNVTAASLANAGDFNFIFGYDITNGESVPQGTGAAQVAFQPNGQITGAGNSSGLIHPNNSAIAFWRADGAVVDPVIKQDSSNNLHFLSNETGNYLFDTANGQISPNGTNKMALGNVNGNWTSIYFGETTAPTIAAASDTCYGDSTLHALKCSYNNGTFFQIPQVITATSAAFATATTAGTCVQNTTAVAGAATTMAVSVSPVSTPGVGAVWSAFVSSAGNVTINECAVATSAGGTIAFNIRVTP